MDYARNKRFFTFPGVDGVLAIIGVAGGSGAIIMLIALLCFFRSLLSDPVIKVMVYPGVAIFLVSTVYFLIKYKRTPKDAELDNEVQDAINQLNKIALSKHGITEEQVQQASPMILGGYMLEEKIAAKLFSSTFRTGAGLEKDQRAIISSKVAMGLVISASAFADGGIPRAKYKKGAQDALVRTSIAEYTVLHFSDKKVFIYTQQFSLIDSEIKELSQSYFYHDIGLISTEVSKYGTHAFIIKLSNGNTLSIPCCDAKATDIKSNITTFMQLIRDKKE
jgi:hypothetical protein